MPEDKAHRDAERTHDDTDGVRHVVSRAPRRWPGISVSNVIRCQMDRSVSSICLRSNDIPKLRDAIDQRKCDGSLGGWI